MERRELISEIIERQNKADWIGELLGVREEEESRKILRFLI